MVLWHEKTAGTLPAQTTSRGAAARDKLVGFDSKLNRCVLIDSNPAIRLGCVIMVCLMPLAALLRLAECTYLQVSSGD